MAIYESKKMKKNWKAETKKHDEKVTSIRRITRDDVRTGVKHKQRSPHSPIPEGRVAGSIQTRKVKDASLVQM